MLELAIGARALAHPGAVNGVRRGLELLHRIIADGFALVLDRLQLCARQPFHRLAVERLLIGRAFAGDDLRQAVFE